MCRINNLANTLTEYIMIKTKTILMTITVFVALLIGSCEKEDNSPDDNNKNTGTQFIADYSVAKDSVLRSIPREYIDTARTTHNISLPTGKLMQCGRYWQELPAGTESEEVGSKNRILFCLTSIKNPNHMKYAIWVLCPEQESNLHDQNRSPGPQPGASTSSAIWA